MLRKPGYGQIFFEADTGGNSGTSDAMTTSTTGTPPGTGESEAVTFSAAQQKEINRLIGKARSEGKTTAEQAAAQAETDRQAEADRQADIAKGNFEKVETDLKSERDAFKSERDILKTSLDAANVVIGKQVETLKGELPAELLTDYPADVPPLDQLAWLEARKSVFAVAQTVAGVPAGTIPRLPVTPKGGGQAPTVEQMANRMRSNISI